jgi:threonine synthase
MIATLVDSISGKIQPENHTHYLSADGNLLDLQKSFSFSPADIDTRIHGLWRYKRAIPTMPLVTFGEGFTPLLAIKMWGKEVFIKQEQLFSTGSYKDRGATVLMSHAKSMNISEVVQDSSGNAGCAIAAYAAAAAMACHIYLTTDTSPAKTIQMKAYGASIHSINGNRSDAAKAAYLAAEKLFYASHCFNPYFYEGTKTFAYELLEQLNWQSSDAVVLPAGNGTLILGCYIAFTELAHHGVIDSIPKIIAVQANHCAPLYKAFTEQKSLDSVNIETKPTLAEGIAIADPVRGKQMLNAIRKTGGTVVSVSEEEIKDAWKYCGQLGYYIEPTSAATIAGMKQYMEGHPHEKIVSLFSGSGLKSTDKALKIDW